MSGWMKFLGITALVIVVILIASLWSDWRSAQAAADGANTRQLELEKIAARMAVDPSVIGVTITEDSPGKFSLQVERQELPTPIHEAHYDGVDPRVVEELKQEIERLRGGNAGVPIGQGTGQHSEQTEQKPRPVVSTDPPKIMSVADAAAPGGAFEKMTRGMLLDGSYVLLVDWTRKSGGYAIYRYRPAEDDYVLETWPLSTDEARVFNARPEVGGMFPPNTKAISKGTRAQLLAKDPPLEITLDDLERNDCVRDGSCSLIYDNVTAHLERMAGGDSAMLKYEYGPYGKALAYYKWDNAEKKLVLHEYPIKERAR